MGRSQHNTSSVCSQVPNESVVLVDREVRSVSVRQIVVLAVVIALGGVFLVVTNARHQSTDRRRTAYQVVHDWPVLPEGWSLDIVAGVGVDSRGDVIVFHRAGRKWPST